ncbi:MAG TPA: hypothetical protein PLQ97_06745 [Myxococcota bacterium]|nr:hypothetical protein [Myxococcota bacterium]HQK50640.1 hypothetical protein [Myxococcota bacterium]
MPTLVRHVVASVALVAFLGAIGEVRPCLDDDDCERSCSSAAAAACPESDQHHDPKPPVHSCDCMCHVPGIAMTAPAGVRSDASVELCDVPVRGPVTSGFLDSLFRPPRA